MEWYWILTIAVAFFGLVGVLYWLRENGKLGLNDMDLVAQLIPSLSKAANALANATESKSIDIFAFAMTLLEKAVLAAENAFYNDEIAADERHEVCMEKFDELLEAAHVELTGAQRNVVDTLIAAACEQMGHSLVGVEMDEAVDSE